VIITIAIFVAVLAVLVLSHEFGHFIVAKKSGMRVDEFGFDFPSRIASIKKGETRYSFNLFPIGGFVKIFGEDGGSRNDIKSFSSRPVWIRSLVIVAGVLTNLLFAYILFSVGHMIGTPKVLDDNDVSNKTAYIQIVDVAPNSPADEAGVKVGDKVLRIFNESKNINTVTVQEVQNFIIDNKGAEVNFEIERAGEKLTLKTSVRENFPQGEGATGIALVRIGTVKYPWYRAFVEGAKTFWLVASGTLGAFGDMIKNAVLNGTLPKDVSGPVGIAYLTGTVRNLGFIYLLQFVALISLNLGIINLIPFPALDGGRLLFLLIEKIKGSPVSKKVEGATHAVGFAILILLVIAATFNDINKFF